jgi:hypothetical protein
MSEVDRTMKRNWVIGMVSLVVILAAFLAGRYLHVNGALWSGWIDQEYIVRSTSAELPATVPDVFGSVAAVKDRGLSVKEYPVIGGSVNVGSEGGGDEASLDVIVTRETVVYEDVTDRSEPVLQDGVNMQVVNKSELDQIGSNAFVMIWGRRQDGRIIADVLCFQNR